MCSSDLAFTSPTKGAWTEPGPATEPLQARLCDGSLVTYRWYRFVDQPTFQQYAWSAEKKAALQAGMRTLRGDGAFKVLAGVTSIEEVMIVTAEDQG